MSSTCCFVYISAILRPSVCTSVSTCASCKSCLQVVHEGAAVPDGAFKLGVNLHCHRSNLRTRVLAGCTAKREAEGEEGAAGGAAVSHIFV